MKSYLGCICLTWLYCVFSNVSSKYLDQRRYNRIGCIGLAFLQCAFSCASSSFLFETMHDCTGCIYLSFSHCSFPNASSKYLNQIMQNHNVCIYTNFSFVCLKIYPQILCIQGCILTPLAFVWRFSAMYFQMCFSNCLFVVEAYSHWSHLVDFSPLCVLKCVFKLAFQGDAKWHWSH